MNFLFTFFSAATILRHLPADLGQAILEFGDGLFPFVEGRRPDTRRSP